MSASESMRLQVLWDMFQNRPSSCFETQRCRSITLHEHIRSQQLGDFPLASLLNRHTSRFWGRKDSLLMQCFGQSSGHVFPGNSLSVDKIVTTLRRASNLLRYCDIDNLQDKFQRVIDMDLDSI